MKQWLFDIMYFYLQSYNNVIHVICVVIDRGHYIFNSALLGTYNFIDIPTVVWHLYFSLALYLHMVASFQPPPWPQKHVHENRCIKDNLMSETPSTRLLHNKIDLNWPPKVLPQPQDFPWGGNIFESYLSTQNMSPLSLLELLQIGFVISHCGKSIIWDCQIGSWQQNRHK